MNDEQVGRTIDAIDSQIKLALEHRNDAVRRQEPFMAALLEGRATGLRKARDTLILHYAQANGTLPGDTPAATNTKDKQ